MQGIQVWSLGREDPFEKETATHSSILEWKNPMNRETWHATVHDGKELDTTEQLGTHEWPLFSTSFLTLVVSWLFSLQFLIN